MALAEKVIGYKSKAAEPVIEIPALRENNAVFASDEDVSAASSYILAEHIEAYKELAKYDSD
ncbi:hypothetical protein R80B4_01991 [Fibrobacteres bacterium R8-0-B4]